MKWIKCKDRLPESNGGFYLRNAPELFASLEMDRDGHTIALSVYDQEDDEMVYTNSWDLSKRPDCPWEWLDESTTPERERELYDALAGEYQTLAGRGTYSDEFLNGYKSTLWDFKIILKDTFGIEVPEIK